jgi:hypothetical protein
MDIEDQVEQLKELEDMHVDMSNKIRKLYISICPHKNKISRGHDDAECCCSLCHKVID